MQHKIITTVDGSHTIFVPELNEHYHSTNGAIQESNHVFIEKGFRYYLRKQKQPQQEINILEIGFGTGLNVFLTLLESEKWPVNVFYNSIELYPITIEEAQKLNYSELVDNQVNISLFLELHTTPWEKAVDITPSFTLLKQKFDFSKPDEFKSDRLFNLIYFDAFAPEKQPDMWTQEIFNKIYSLSDKDAVFTTYCAKGVVRRMLQTAGFKMERLPGPPGKREILRGSVV
ncbi:MAG: tRNA (5-methylaminomethyl-2-thiouridine)(34)-methyltransferase MnmD [Fermentimonas sp.]|nr:tRNA (5-methylaminomethyl-2-thiouridine)(34)-methyltransferase MnmD [Fermentimonas sp.]